MQARLQGQRLLHAVREQTEHQQSGKVEFLVYLDRLWIMEIYVDIDMVYQFIGRGTLPLDCMLWTKELF